MNAIAASATPRLCGPASPAYAAKLAHTLALLRKAAADAPCAFASSLSAEDMVLLDLIAAQRLPIAVFTLDTGRLHAETLELATRAEQRYGLPITRFEPQAEAVLHYVQRHGRDAFYESVALRRACCAIRKTEPLARALAGRKSWLTGQRRAQSSTRGELAETEWDAVHGLAKYNPLADWSEGDVWHYIDTHTVPYNPLHDQFYPSIGCAPCTRAVSPGEDIRAGRWWWESPQSKECGLHVSAANHSTAVKESA